jgi:NAD(P)-dependent dehydrogenase (short-subunit alcohol dehydrogenase family)
MRTLIIGSSGGIGAALLAASRPNAIGLSRSQHGLDITDEASIAAHLGALEAPFDRIIIATGALELNGAKPEKSLRALDAAAMSAQFALNALGPTLVLKHTLRLIPRDRPAHIAALSARVGSIGDNALGGWHSYRAAKAALNQFFHTAAIEIARTHPHACVALIHPGTVATSLGTNYSGNHPTTPPDQAAQNILHVLQGLTAANTGQFFDWQGKAIPW